MLLPHSPVEVSAPGIQPSVLILFHYGSIEIPSLESLVQDVGCHSGGVHCGVNALSRHRVRETSCIPDNENVVCKRCLFTSDTKSSWKKIVRIKKRPIFIIRCCDNFSLDRRRGQYNTLSRHASIHTCFKFKPCVSSH